VRFLLTATLIVSLTACGAHLNPSVPMGPAEATMALPNSSPLVYVANRDSNPGVLGFHSQANGDPAPAFKLEGSKTTLSDPDSLALDAAGDVYVADDGSSEVKIFAAGKHGNVAPSWTIGGSRTKLGPTEGLFIDPVGNLYVTDYSNDAVREFAAGKHGNIMPIRSIKGSKTQMDTPVGMAMDSDGTLYVANKNGPSIVEYAAGIKGDVSPTHVIEGSKTGLSRPFALAIDSNGRLLVADESVGILVFAKGAHGNVAPKATITGFIEVAGVTADAQDHIYAADFGGNAIEEFASNANGPASPLRKIEGVKTMLSADTYPVLH
jgi:sugar lactone lactonase YvrE